MGKALFTLIFLIFVSFNSSCRSQNQSKKECEEAYYKAIDLRSRFFISHDTALLREALINLDSSLTCPHVSGSVIEIKLSTLSMIGDFDRTLRFLDSTRTSDFARKYQKQFYVYSCKALINGNRGNTLLQKAYYDSAVKSVEHYLQSNTEFSKDAFGDLYFIKSKILSREAFDRELDSLKTIYPSQKILFEALKDTYYQ
jgi:hypothetical protein